MFQKKLNSKYPFFTGLVLLFVSAFLFSCSSDDDSSGINDISEKVNGEWKLIQTEYYAPNTEGEFVLIVTDYSTKNIIYKFDSNHKLIVLNDANSEYPAGEYDYHVVYDYPGGSSEAGNKEYLVNIEGIEWLLSFPNNEKMILDLSYVDGGKLIFEKIQE